MSQEYEEYTISLTCNDAQEHRIDLYPRNIKWDNRYLDLATSVGNWSKDPRTKVGAVVVGPRGEIVSQGYNGFPRGVQDSAVRLENRDLKHKYVVHAELNAILNAARNGASVEGTTMYIDGLPPCNECAKAIVQSGISRVVARVYGVLDGKWNDSFTHSRIMFAEAGVDILLVDFEGNVIDNAL